MEIFYPKTYYGGIAHEKENYVHLIALALIFAGSDYSVFASDAQTENYRKPLTLDEYISEQEDITGNIVDAKIIRIPFSVTDIANAKHDISPIKADNLGVYAVTVVTENEDGTYSTYAFIEFDEDSDGNLVPATRSSGNGDESHDYYRGGFKVTMRATYYYVSMVDYGASGYAFAPSYSRFTMTSTSASGTPYDTYFYTLLHGTYAVSNTDPTTRYSSFPYYSRTYNTSSPTLGYTYAFNDYALYSNPYYTYGGYSGQLIHIPNGGQGCYYLKTEFYYSGSFYSAMLPIYNI